MKTNIVKMTEWKNLYPIKKIILLSVWLFGVLILYASFAALIKDHDFRTIFIIILDSVGLVKSFIPIKKYILTSYHCMPVLNQIFTKKELEKLQKNLGGIKEMKKLPDAIFIVDPKKERICVQEAHTLGIPLIGIADTNCDPEELDYVIPGNDDAIRAVKLIVSKMADAVIEANQGEAADAEEIFAEETEEVVEE